MLMAQQPPHGMPWMQQPMPAMSAMPFMPPPMDATAAAHPPQATLPPEVAADAKVQMSAQQKLNKIMKAVKKEDNLSPEFQQLVHTEMKKDDRESTDVLLEAVKELGDTKEALLELESARLQLWSQWRVFLQQSVTKWKEYTSQFQASELAFHGRMQEATNNLRRAQRKVDWAKKRADTVGPDGAVSLLSEDEMEDTDNKDEDELPRDENAQRIHDGLNQVVTSLVQLSESADKLEPKPKRPRTKEEEDASTSRAAMPSLQPFHKAGTT